MEHQIKNAKYEGYLWQSDQSKPRIIGEGEPLSLTLIDGENPFVVEGLLWNREENISTQIRYVDGKYFIATYEVKQEEQEELADSATMTPVTYLPHRLPGVKALKFLRQWEEVKDELCENMPTLQLKANIFVGFEK